MRFLFLCLTLSAHATQDALKARCFEKNQGRACIELGTTLWQTPASRGDAIAAFRKGCALHQESGCTLMKMKVQPPFAPPKNVSYIRQLGPARYEVKRAAVLERGAQDLGQVTRSARSAPSLRADGTIEGYRLEQMDAGGVLTRLGFRPGDVVLTVNGQAVDSTDAATLLLTALPFTDVYSVAIRRNGEPLTLTYALTD